MSLEAQGSRAKILREAPTPPAKPRPGTNQRPPGIVAAFHCDSPEREAIPVLQRSAPRPRGVRAYPWPEMTPSVFQAGHLRPASGAGPRSSGWRQARVVREDGRRPVCEAGTGPGGLRVRLATCKGRRGPGRCACCTREMGFCTFLGQMWTWRLGDAGRMPRPPGSRESKLGANPAP